MDSTNVLADAIETVIQTSDETNDLYDTLETIIISTTAQTRNFVCYNSVKTDDRADKMESEKYDALLDAARNEIGRKIREAREAQRLKAYEVAKMAGVSQPTITHIENGRKWSKVDIYGRICNALGLKLGELLQPLDEEDSLTSAELDLIHELKKALIKQRQVHNLIAKSQENQNKSD